ncbi:MAG: hypothetical protein DIU80_022595 [Chloroflexota bacterium]|nr:MAG: hypothetical protein DIU80_12135 [Chloroflexota bacterium]
MKRKLGMMVASAAVAVGLMIPAGSATAQNATTAYSTKFSTAITYQNISTEQANVRIQLFADGSGSPITVDLSPLAAGAGTSVAIGSLSANGLSDGFQGGAVMSSDQPIVATMVQVPVQSNMVTRPLSNGFSPDSGAASVLLATILKNSFNQTSKFSVQNVDSSPADVKIEFFDATSTPPGAKIDAATINISALPAGSVKLFDAGTIPGLPDSFNGSAIVTSTRTGSSAPGRMVATVIELSTIGLTGNAFEGITQGGTKIFMPSAQCQAFSQESAYAVQNTSTTASTNIRVTYQARPENSDPDTTPLTTYVDTFENLGPGAKRSFFGCTVMPAGYFGSAVIESVDSSGNPNTAAPIVAIGKIVGAGLNSASPGVASGASKLALPYVRFANDAGFFAGSQRASIAIQNVGSDLPAGAVKVTYYDKNGAVVGTHTLGAIPANAKVNSNPTMATPASPPPSSGTTLDNFGFYPDGTFGGSAVVEGPAGSQLVAVVRIISPGAGEDYNGIPIP